MSTPTLQLEQPPKLKDYQDRLGTKLVRDPSQTKPVMDAVLELINQEETKAITVTDDDVYLVGAINLRIAELDQRSDDNLNPAVQVNEYKRLQKPVRALH